MRGGKFYSKLNEKKNLTKVAELSDIFLVTLDKVEKYVELMQSNCSDDCVRQYSIEILSLFYPELQLAHSTSIIKTN